MNIFESIISVKPEINLTFVGKRGKEEFAKVLIAGGILTILAVNQLDSLHPFREMGVALGVAGFVIAVVVFEYKV